MKKMLIMAMAVFTLMACENSSETGLPKGEAKALEVSTAGAIDALGDSPAEVDAALTEAGYQKIKSNPFFAPARAAIRRDVGDGNEEETEMYAYGIPDNYDKMTEEQATAWLNNAIDDGKAIIIVTATFEATGPGVALKAMATFFIIKKSDKANKSFTATSDKMYAQLGADKSWAGTVIDGGFSAIGYIFSGSNIRKKGTQYTDHSAFVSKVAKAEGISAIENGASNSKDKDYGYYNVWANPNAEEEKVLLNYGFDTPICMGVYSVATVEYGDMD